MTSFSISQPFKLHFYFVAARFCVKALTFYSISVVFRLVAIWKNHEVTALLLSQ